MIEIVLNSWFVGDRISLTGGGFSIIYCLHGSFLCFHFTSKTFGEIMKCNMFCKKTNERSKAL